MSLFSSGSPASQVIGPLMLFPVVVIAIKLLQYLTEDILKKFGMPKNIAGAFGIITLGGTAISGVTSLFSGNQGSPVISKIIIELVFISLAIILIGIVVIFARKKLGFSEESKQPKKSSSNSALVLIAIAGSLFLVLQTKTVKNQIVNQNSNTQAVPQVTKPQTATSLPPEELSRRKEAYWRAYNQKEDDCRFPTTSSLILECQRREGNRRQGFEIRWKQQIQAGWVPPPTP